MAKATTPTELAALLRPYVGTMRSIHRTDGSRVDVLHLVNSVDADVRGVTSEGVELSHDGFARFVPWGEVRSVTVAVGGAERVFLTDAELVRLSHAHRRFMRERRYAAA